MALRKRFGGFDRLEESVEVAVAGGVVLRVLHRVIEHPPETGLVQPPDGGGGLDGVLAPAEVLVERPPDGPEHGLPGQPRAHDHPRPHHPDAEIHHGAHGRGVEVGHRADKLRGGDRREEPLRVSEIDRRRRRLGGGVLLLETSKLGGDGCRDGGRDGVEGPGEEAEVAGEGPLRGDDVSCSHQQDRLRGGRADFLENGSLSLLFDGEEKDRTFLLPSCLWLAPPVLWPVREKIQSLVQDERLCAHL